MYETTTLKQGLRNLKKKDLVTLGKNHGIDAPYKMKKEDLVMVFNDLIPERFIEEIFYFSPNELMVYSDDFSKMFGDLDQTQVRESLQKVKDDILIPNLPGKSNEDVSMEEVYQTFDLIKKMIMNEDVDNLNYLINMGYALLSRKDKNSTFKIPSELKEVFLTIMEKRGNELLDYQSLQMHIVSLLNLYGVCSYHQLHKMHKKRTGSPLTLEKVIMYVVKLSEQRPLCQTTLDYFYNDALHHEEFKTIIDSDLNRDYYIPTEEELTAYSYAFFRPKAAKNYQELKEIILNHSKTLGPINEDLVSYSEALKWKDGPILKAYEKVLDAVLFYGKMGYGLYDFISILDQEYFKFNTLNQMNRAYSLYLEFQENTRKWPLKGALYSEL